MNKKNSYQLYKFYIFIFSGVTVINYQQFTEKVNYFLN